MLTTLAKRFRQSPKLDSAFSATGLDAIVVRATAAHMVRIALPGSITAEIVGAVQRHVRQRTA